MLQRPDVPGPRRNFHFRSSSPSPRSIESGVEIRASANATGDARSHLGPQQEAQHDLLRANQPNQRAHEPSGHARESGSNAQLQIQHGILRPAGSSSRRRRRRRKRRHIGVLIGGSHEEDSCSNGFGKSRGFIHVFSFGFDINGRPSPAKGHQGRRGRSSAGSATNAKGDADFAECRRNESGK